jgi:hypothetical protein
VDFRRLVFGLCAIVALAGCGGGKSPVNVTCTYVVHQHGNGGRVAYRFAVRNAGDTAIASVRVASALAPADLRTTIAPHATAVEYTHAGITHPFASSAGIFACHAYAVTFENGSVWSDFRSRKPR